MSLGKKYAGRSVSVDEVEEGVWRIKLGQFVSDAELRLEEPEPGEASLRAEAGSAED